MKFRILIGLSMALPCLLSAQIVPKTKQQLIDSTMLRNTGSDSRRIDTVLVEIRASRTATFGSGPYSNGQQSRFIEWKYVGCFKCHSEYTGRRIRQFFFTGKNGRVDYRQRQADLSQRNLFDRLFKIYPGKLFREH